MCASPCVPWTPRRGRAVSWHQQRGRPGRRRVGTVWVPASAWGCAAPVLPFLLLPSFLAAARVLGALAASQQLGVPWGTRGQAGYQVPREQGCSLVPGTGFLRVPPGSTTRTPHPLRAPHRCPWGRGRWGEAPGAEQSRVLCWQQARGRWLPALAVPDAAQERLECVAGSAGSSPTLAPAPRAAWGGGAQLLHQCGHGDGALSPQAGGS